MKKTTKSSRVRHVVYFTALKPADEKKLSPQANAIVAALHGVGQRVTRKDLIKLLTPSKLKTDQEPSRVLSYYKKELLSGRWIKVEKEVAPAKTKAKKEVPAPAPVPAVAPVAPAPAAVAPAPVPVPVAPSAPAQG